MGSNVSSLKNPFSGHHNEKHQQKQTEFVLRLLSELHQGGKNVVLSPYSVISALVMLLVGADGNTRDQLVQIGMAIYR